MQTLAGTHNMNKPKKTCVVETVNPKAVTGEESAKYDGFKHHWLHSANVLSTVHPHANQQYNTFPLSLHHRKYTPRG